MNNLKSLLVALVVGFLMIVNAGCLSARKVDKLVAKYYEDVEVDIKNTDYMQFSRDSSDLNNKVSTTNRVKKTLLPLLLYWNWNYEFHTEVNNSYALSSLSKEIAKYADTVGLKNKLNGNTLQLTLGEYSTNFDLNFRGGVLYLMITAITTSLHLDINPSKEFLYFSYQVMNGNKEIKKGKIKVRNPATSVTTTSEFAKPAMLVGDYLSKFEHGMKMVGKEVVDKLIVSL